MENNIGNWVLSKEDPWTVYFKCKDRTGHTFTSSKKDAMKFESKIKAISYNHETLYGDCEVSLIQ